MYTTGCVPASIRRHLESVEGLADRWASFSAAELSFFLFCFSLLPFEWTAPDFTGQIF